jgi:hypothetical protein
MWRFKHVFMMLILVFSTFSQSTAEAHYSYCYGTPYCQVSQGARYGVVYHNDDGTYWSQDGTVQYNIGKIQDAYSPTGWTTWYYAVPRKSATNAIQNYAPLAAQGTSLYGYQQTDTVTYGAQPSYQSAATAYVPDYSQFLNQAARLAEQSQQLSAQGYQGFVASTTLLNSQQLDLAKIVATKDAAVAALNAAKGNTPESIQRSVTLTLHQDSAGNVTVTPQQPAAAARSPADDFISVVANNCSQCHAANAKRSEAAEARKHLRLEEYAQWTPDTFKAISDAVDTDKMPPGHKLSRGDKGKVFAMEDFVRGGNQQQLPPADPQPEQPVPQPPPVPQQSQPMVPPNPQPEH